MGPINVSVTAVVDDNCLTRLSFEVFSLESPWTLDYVLAPLPPLGIVLSVAVREGGGGFNSSALGKPMYKVLASNFAYNPTKSCL